MKENFIHKLRFITPPPLFYREKQYLSVMTVCLSVPRNFLINRNGLVLKIQDLWGVTRVDW
jgi:hypothetical protein